MNKCFHAAPVLAPHLIPRARPDVNNKIAPVRRSQSDIDELTFAALESDPPVVGQLDAEHSPEFTKAIVDRCHVNAARHNHEHLRSERVGAISGVRDEKDSEGYEELKGEHQQGHVKLILFWRHVDTLLSWGFIVVYHGLSYRNESKAKAPQKALQSGGAQISS